MNKLAPGTPEMPQSIDLGWMQCFDTVDFPTEISRLGALIDRPSPKYTI